MPKRVQKRVQIKQEMHKTIKNQRDNYKDDSCRDTRYPSNEIYLHPVKDGFGSTLALYLLIFTATG
ncbi:hypothetical protein EIC70_01235 [Escherichia coli]|nr:hypothetical protein [Escherichia coli]